MTLEEEDEEEGRGSVGRSGRSDYWDVVGCCHGQKGRTEEHTWDLKARTLFLTLSDDGTGRQPRPEGTPQMTSVGQKNNRSYIHALCTNALSSC